MNEQSGNLFRGVQSNRDEDPHTDADLVEEACVAKQESAILCSAYAWGYDPSRLVNEVSEDDRKRVAALVASDWPPLG